MKKIVPIKKHEFLFSLVLLELLILSSSLSSFQEKRDLTEDNNYFPAHSLIGVILSKDPASSIAILKNERNKKITLLKIGDSILDMKLIQVFENRIVLQKGGRTFQIFLGQSNLFNVNEKLNRPSPTSVKEPPVAPPMNDQPIIDFPTKEFSRSEVERRIREEWSLIIQETRFVPNIVDGKISGFKITKLPSKTILTDTGILQNDIIKEVNGIRLNDMKTLFSLFDRLREESQFEVHVERNGKLHRLFYTLK